MMRFGNLLLKPNDHYVEIPFDWNAKLIVPMTTEVMAAISLMLEIGVVCERNGYSDDTRLTLETDTDRVLQFRMETSIGKNLMAQITNGQRYKAAKEIAANDDNETGMAAAE